MRKAYRIFRLDAVHERDEDGNRSFRIEHFQLVLMDFNGRGYYPDYDSAMRDLDLSARPGEQYVIHGVLVTEDTRYDMGHRISPEGLGISSGPRNLSKNPPLLSRDPRLSPSNGILGSPGSGKDLGSEDNGEGLELRIRPEG